MNYLELLPKELYEYIYSILKTEAIIIIQKKWHKFRAPKIAATYLREQTYCHHEWGYVSPNTSSPDLANLMEHLVKVLSGKESGWSSFFLEVEQELWIDQYTGGPGEIYYIRTETALETLKKRFGNCIHTDSTQTPHS